MLKNLQILAPECHPQGVKDLHILAPGCHPQYVKKPTNLGTRVSSSGS